MSAMATGPSTRVVVRTFLTIVAVAIFLYLLWLLRRPISWILIALFLAVALSHPVNSLNRRMRRGFAITIVYLGLLLLPVLAGMLIIPPLVTQLNNLVQDLPRYATDLQEFVAENETLASLERDYNITEKVQAEAEKLPGRIGDAAGVLSDIGLGVVNSLFALITILVLTGFMLGGGRSWVERGLQLGPPDRMQRIERALDRMAGAVGGYVAGAFAQATVAGVTAYIVLEILGVPFAAPLAFIMFIGDLIPLVGATIAAVLIGIVTVFVHFPTATIIWTIWAIAYQQIENSLIQPQIQKRAVDVHPFIVIVSVLFGSTLIGVMGALVAIPVAASVQIGLREWWAWRRELATESIANPAAAGQPAGTLTLPGATAEKPRPPGTG
jgi:predicted PurR-regulated permease PerM